MKKSGITISGNILLQLLVVSAAGNAFAQQKNGNLVAVQAALSTVCSNLAQLSNPSSPQLELLDSCASQVDNQGQGFTLNENRLVPEEVLIFSDSIVSLTGLKVSNGLGSLRKLRAGDAVTESAQTHNSKSLARDRSVFVSTRFAISQFKSGGLQSATDNYSGAISVGTNFHLKPSMIAGVALNFLRQDTEFHTDGGDVYMNGGSVSLYGTWFQKKQGYADVVLDLGYHKFNLRRKINLFNETRQFAIGKTDATVASLTVGVGRDFSRLGFEFGPYFRMSLTEGYIGGYTESAYESDSGTGSLLYVNSHKGSSKKLSVGAQILRVFGKNKRISILPQLRVEVETELEDRKDNITASFVHDPENTPFTVQGDRRDPLYMNTGLGLTLTSRSGNSAYMLATSQWKNDYVLQHGLKLGISLIF